jgi:hypothetical protein
MFSRRIYLIYNAAAPMTSIFPPERRFAVFHRVTKKKLGHFRKLGLPKLAHCSALAFYRDHPGTLDPGEIPATCMSCGQPLSASHLDLSDIVSARPPAPAARTRPRRHYGPAGSLVVEV